MKTPVRSEKEIDPALAEWRAKWIASFERLKFSGGRYLSQQVDEIVYGAPPKKRRRR